MGKKKTTPCFDHKGNEYPSKTAMCEAYGITLGAYLKRLKRHPGDIMYALEGGKVEDPTTPGKYYPSQVVMCEAYGITPEVYRSRIKLGWDRSDALTMPVEVGPGHQSQKVTVNGVEYRSITEACAKLGISTTTYYQRLRYGWSKERALSTPILKKRKRPTK